MRALDVVGEDLQLGLRVDLRVLGEQQRLVGLLGVGLLGVDGDDDLAVEDGAGLPVQDPLVELVARAVRLRVVDRRVVVDQPAPVRQIETVERALHPFAVEQRLRVVAHDGAPEGDRVGREVGGPSKPDVHRADVVTGEALAHQLVVIDHGARPGYDLGHRVRQVRGIAPAVALDDPHLRVLADDEQHARMGHHRLAAGGRRRDEQQLDRLLDHGVGGHAHDRAVVEQRGVERRERLVLDAGDPRPDAPRPPRGSRSRPRQARPPGSTPRRPSGSAETSEAGAT